MATPGDVIEHPGMGLRIRFVATGRETSGEVVRFETWVAPGHSVAVAHVHPNQEETTEVLSGAIRGRVDGEERTAAAGETNVMEAGIPHLWWNASAEEDAHLMVEMRPAMTTDVLLEGIFALGRAGRTRPDGVPRMLDLAVLQHDNPGQFYAARPSVAIQRALLATVWPVARLLGRGRPD